jgi:hypothetical protein
MHSPFHFRLQKPGQVFNNPFILLRVKIVFTFAASTP